MTETSLPPPPPPGEPATEFGSIYVGNLHLSTTDQEVTDLFAKFGAIRAVRMVRNPDGQFRGFAFVDFVDGSAVPTAIKELNQTPYKGMTISVEKAKRKWGDRPVLDRFRGSGSRFHNDDRFNDYDERYERRRYPENRYRERSPPRRYVAYDEQPPRAVYQRDRSPERSRRGRFDDDYYRG